MHLHIQPVNHVAHPLLSQDLKERLLRVTIEIEEISLALGRRMKSTLDPRREFGTGKIPHPHGSIAVLLNGARTIELQMGGTILRSPTSINFNTEMTSGAPVSFETPDGVQATTWHAVLQSTHVEHILLHLEAGLVAMRQRLATLSTEIPLNTILSSLPVPTGDQTSETTVPAVA